MATIFPEGEDGRIPVVSVTGENGTGATTRCIAHILRGTGWRVGHACTEGIFVNEHQADLQDCSGSRGAQLALLNPQVEAAVLQLSSHGILSEGLGFDRCSVAVVTNRKDELDAERLTSIQRIVVESVLDKGLCVLNAQDPLIAGLAACCPGQVLLFANEPTHPAIVAHRSQGGRAVFSREGAVIVAHGDREFHIALLSDLPLTQGECNSSQLETVLAAAAAAWSFDLSEELIRAGLRSFEAEAPTQSPGSNGWAPHGANGAETNGDTGSPLASVGEKLA